MLSKVADDLIRLVNISCSELPNFEFILKLIVFKLKKYRNRSETSLVFSLLKLQQDILKFTKKDYVFIIF